LTSKATPAVATSAHCHDDTASRPPDSAALNNWWNAAQNDHPAEPDLAACSPGAPLPPGFSLVRAFGHIYPLR